MMPVFARRYAGIAIVLLAVCLPIFGLAAYLYSKSRWADSRLSEIEPRYARLLGLEASRGELDRAVVESAAVVARHVHAGSRDVSQVGNDAQQRIRDIATQSGLSIVSSQVLPAKIEGPFDRIPLAVNLEGELPALQAALLGIASQTPAINVQGLSVQTIGAVKADLPQRLAIRFNLFVLRSRS